MISLCFAILWYVDIDIISSCSIHPVRDPLEVSTSDMQIRIFSSISSLENTMEARSLQIDKLFTCQPNSRTRQILRLTQPAQRNPSFHIRPLAFICHIFIVQLRSNRTWQEGVGANVVFPQRTG